MIHITIKKMDSNSGYVNFNFITDFNNWPEQIG